MSLARIYTQTFSGKSKNVSTCEGCRQPIVKGESYSCFKVGFRSRYQHNYHARCAHLIKDSTRESSKLSAVFAARENAIDNVDAEMFDGDASSFVDNLRGHLEAAADDWDSVAEEYRDAAEAMGGAGESMRETADSIESAASTLRDWSPSNDEPDLDHESHADDDRDDEDEATAIADCDECQGVIAEWIDEVQSSARDAITDAESEIEVS